MAANDEGSSPKVIRVNVHGVELEFDSEKHEMRWAGGPTVSMWVESSALGLMVGMRRMAGLARFKLALKSGGYDSVEGDWAVITSRPTFEEGFVAMANNAWMAGWGHLELLSIDREKKELRFRAHNTWESIYQKKLGVNWGCNLLAGKFAGIAARLFGTTFWADQTAFAAAGDPFDEFWVYPSEVTAEDKLRDLLHDTDAPVADLPLALEKLENEVRERKQIEEDLRDKLALISKQKEDMLAMSSPILQIWDGVLALPVIGSLDSARAAEIMDKLLSAIVSSRARYAILDLTGVDQVDTTTAEHLLRIMRAVELLGATSVVTGIRPAVANTMSSLGVNLSGIVTLGNLKEGLTACMRWMAEGR